MDCVLVLISDLQKLKAKIDGIYRRACERSIPYNWNFLTRWANTPILWKYLIEFGFRETSIGPPNLILDMAIGKLMEPSWTDVIYYTAGCKVYRDKVQEVSIDWLNYFRDHSSFFKHRYAPLPIITLWVSLLRITIQQFYYGRDLDDSKPWVLAEIVSIPTMVLTVLCYSLAILMGGVIPLLMAYQNYKGWRHNSPGAALWYTGAGIVWAFLTKFASSIYNHVVFGATLSFNGIFLCLVSMACLLLFMTRSYKQEAQGWSW